MTTQHALTVITRIDPRREQELRDILAGIESCDVEKNRLIPFAKITTIQFARFVVIPDAVGTGAQLAFSTNFDGDLDEHLRQVVSVGREGLERIYACCSGFPSGSDDAIVSFLKS